MLQFDLYMSIYFPQIFEKIFALKFCDANESENSFPRVLLSFCVFGEYVENCLSVHGEYGESSVVWDTQSRLRIRGKNLCAHGEDAKRHKIRKLRMS